MRNATSRTFRIAPVALAATLAFAALLAGCNSGGVGIFYSLQKETKIVPLSTTLPSGLVVTSMTTLNGWYLINGETTTHTSSVSQAKVASGVGASLSWQSVPTPTIAGVTAPRCLSLVAWNGAIYAVFATDTSNSGTVTGSYGLYQAAVDPTNGINAAANWSAVGAFSASALPSGAAVQDLFVAGPTAGSLFVSVLLTTSFSDGTSSTSYALYEYNGTTATQVIGPSPASGSAVTLPSAPSGVVYDGTNYWVAAGNTLYTSSAATGPFAAATTQPPAPSSSYTSNSILYSGIHWSSALNTLFVATRQGYAYAYNGGTWTQFPSSTATALTPLNGIEEFQAKNASTGALNDVVVFGSDAGYYEVDFPIATGYTAASFSIVAPNGSNAISTDVNYVTIALYSAAVVDFYVDASDSADVRVFALTLDGLWRNEPQTSGGTDRTWRID